MSRGNRNTNAEAPFSPMAQTWKQLTVHQYMRGYRSCVRCICVCITTEYYSAKNKKKREILPFGTTWMDLEVMRLREIRQITILDDQTSLWNLNRRKTKLVGKASGLRVSGTDWSGPWIRPVGTTHTRRPSWRAGGSSVSGAVAPGLNVKCPSRPPPSSTAAVQRQARITRRLTAPAFSGSALACADL